MSYHDGMHRLQVQLTTEQVARLRRVAQRRQVSLSALVREAVDLLPADSPGAREALLATIGRHGGAPPDLAERHDDYVADAFGDG